MSASGPGKGAKELKGAGAGPVGKRVSIPSAKAAAMEGKGPNVAKDGKAPKAQEKAKEAEAPKTKEAAPKANEAEPAEETEEKVTRERGANWTPSMNRSLINRVRMRQPGLNGTKSQKGPIWAEIAAGVRSEWPVLNGDGGLTGEKAKKRYALLKKMYKVPYPTI